MTELSKKEYLRRCEECRQRFAFYGVSVAEWARRNGFSVQTVYDVLNGKNMGTKGEAHRVAVTLKIKPGALVESKNMEEVAV